VRKLYGCLPAIAAVLSAAGCGNPGYVRVNEDVYIPESLPYLERAAKEFATASKESHPGDAGSQAPPELSIAVDPVSGLGPEEFRVLVAEGSVRVEGGGAAGAFYGALEAASRLRQGGQLAVPRAGPRVARRIIRSGIEAPGLSAKPASIDWPVFLDRLGSARWNTLAVRCAHPFPWIVRLSRFPKAFDVPDREASARAQALKKLLDGAAERNVGLLVLPADLQAPESFFQSYASGREDRSPLSTLARSYMRECIAELLKAYPQVTGIGVTQEALSWAPPGKAEEVIRSVFLDGIRASGRKAFLFITASAALRIGKLAVPPDIEVLQETDLSPSLLLAPDPPRAQAGGVGPAPCGRLQLRLLTPTAPLLDASTVWVERGAAAAPKAILLDLFGPQVLASANDALLRRESFIAACIGLSAFDPGLRESSWRTLWDESFGPGSRPIIEPVRAVAEVWAELALFHRAERGWNPSTVTEAESGQEALGLRDGTPFVSLVEFALSPAGDARYASTAEAVALEARGGTIGPERRAPLAAAAVMLERSAAALATLRGAAVGSGTGPEAVLAWEVEGAANLGVYHARRIRAGLFLLRHVAGIGGDARGEAEREITEALASWDAAQAAFTKLRQLFPSEERFPDLSSLRREAEKDLRAVEEARADPGGFRASPLFSAPSPLPDTFDFEGVLGFLNLGTGFLDHPLVAMTEDGQVFEAEEFAGTWKVLDDAPGFSGTGIVSSGITGRRAPAGMVLRIALPRPGTFHIWVRALAGGGESRSFTLKVGRVELGPTHERRDGAPQLEWAKAGQAELPGGEVFIEVIDAGPGREGVDSIVITRDGKWAPPRG
jgi:hypothetical protein